MKIYDNTILTDWKECPRKWYWRHYKALRGEGISLPLTFGLSWHSALDTLYEGFQTASSMHNLVDDAMRSFLETWTEQGLPAELDMQIEEAMSPRTPGVAKDMLYNYIAKREYILSDMVLIAVEQPFAVPIFSDRKDLLYAGRLDKVIKFQQYKWVIEHKTTTEYKKDGYFKSTFLNQFTINSQCEGYLYAGNLFFDRIDHVQVDGALVHKKVHDGFKLIPFSRAFDKLDTWLSETQQWIGRVEEAEIRLDNTHPSKLEEEVPKIVPRNTYACVSKYGTCPYFDTCHHYPSGNYHDVPPGFRREAWSPFDVLHLEKLNIEKEEQDA